MDSNVLRPMTMGLPIVTARKRRISPGRCQGNRLAAPIRRLLSIAATRETIHGQEAFADTGYATTSDGYRRFDGRMVLIVGQLKVVIAEIKD